MEFDFSKLGAAERYKLLVGVVLPRPIALVTTIGPSGSANAAPFSFFNVISDDPPLIILGIGGREPARDGDKDTVRNIRQTFEFVVNLVDEALLERMNICAIDFPSDIDELVQAGLTRHASSRVAVPGIAEAPVRLECRLFKRLAVGPQHRSLVLGEILTLSVRDGIVDSKTLHVDIDALDLIGRLHGGGFYLRLTDRIRMNRIAAPPPKNRKC